MLSRDYNHLIHELQQCLTDDLRQKKYRGLSNPIEGHCYVAAEALFHVLGGKDAGLRPFVISLNDGETHWFLRDEKNTIFDPTSAQFPDGVPYENGRCCGFLTKQPSKRAAEVIKRLKERYAV